MENPVIVVALVITGAVLPFIQEELNKIWKLDGRKALVLGSVVAFAASVIALLVTGELRAEQLTVENFVQVFGVVFGVSQVVFQSVKDQLGWTAQ